MGKNWLKEEMTAAVERGPYSSALEEVPMVQQHKEIDDKVKNRQCKVVLWDDIKYNPPDELNVSSVSMVPHKP